MRILIACEESQTVCIAFRERGHEAYSCDILPCSGNHPEWHIQDDVTKHFDDGWDMMIAFPPCTHLAVSGAAHFAKKRADGRQHQGIDFFMKFTQTNIKRSAIENPVGIMSRIYRKPDQIIQPYFFGDGFSKTTCLWLNNLTPLFHAANVDLFNDKITHVSNTDGWFEWIDNKTGKKKRQPKWFWEAFLNAKTHEERSKIRSKTFPGIANAMAEQWG